VEKYRDQTLNDLPAFEGLNPSIEHFSHILCLELDRLILAKNITTLTVILWENEIAWASYRHEHR
jgi:6-pyruvoyltetrahydropterin/6-carboxytetrahydropterin synthase